MPHPTTQPETVGLSVGRERWEFRAAAGRTVPLRREATPAPEIADVAAAVRDALEHPVRFVPLRQALTPDDRVAVVVDEALPRLGELLRGILEAVTAAGVRPEAITLLAPPGGRADWCDELPDAFADVRVESHHPGSRDRLSYLASTAAGRRVYLNRT
ncbi:MAG TPA: lactate racemase domain-containing protein, partial [Gemmataceae bacterium]